MESSKVFDCLSRNCSIFGNHFLEASAGTGKTFAIEHLYVRLLIEGEKPLSLEQILVVTFTRAAARELKERVRNNLERALSFCLEALKRSFSEEAFDYLHVLVEKEDLERAVKRLQDALTLFDQAHIFTIHGFCHRALQEFAEEGVLPLVLRGERAPWDSKGKILEVVRDFLSYQMAAPSYCPLQASLLLAFYGEERVLCQKIIDRIESGKMTSEPTFHELFLLFNQALASCPFSFDESSVLEDFEKMALSFKKLPKTPWEKIFEQAKELISFVKRGYCTRKEWEAFLSSYRDLLFQFFDEGNRKRKSTFQELSFPAFFPWIVSALFPTIQRCLDPKKILYRIAAELKEKSEALWRQEGELPPDILLQKTLTHLQNEKWKEQLRERYRAVIVDEFQDTDPVQWQIFQELFLSQRPLQAFYLVGDPKQSIYRFRSADIYTYLHALEQLGKGSLERLDTNFRSSSSLLEVLNHLFLKNNQWLKLPKIGKILPYLSVKAGRKADLDIGDEKCALHFFMTQDHSRSRRWPSLVVEKDFFLPFLCQEILSLHHKNGISFPSFSVLVKDRYQAARVQKAFSQWKIPFSSKVQHSLARPWVCHSLRLLFEAVCFYEQEDKVKLALGGAYLRWTLIQLRGEQFSFWKEKNLASLGQFRELFQKEGVASLLRKLFFSTWGGEKSILELLQEHEEREFYLQTLDLLCLLLEKDQRKKLPFSEIFSFLREEEEQGKGVFVFGEEGVQVLTTHGAKGLEFDIVFALGLASRHLSREEEESEEDRKEQGAEKLRQLYVALTRAKRRVYVPLVFDERKKICEEEDLSPLELFFSPMMEEERLTREPFLAFLDPLVRENKASFSLLDKSVEEGLFPQEEPLPSSSQGFFRSENFSFPKKILLSFSSLSSLKGESVSSFKGPLIKALCPENREIFRRSFECPSSIYLTEDKERKALERNSEKIRNGFDQGLLKENSCASETHSLTSGTQKGILLHQILEGIFRRKGFADSSWWRKVIEEKTAGSCWESHTERFFEMVSHLFSLSLTENSPSFTLQEINPRHIYSEMEFHFSLPYTKETNYRMKGFIDLCFFHQGKFYCMDWKSNYLERYEREDLELAMEKNQYFIQAAIYEESLRRWVGSFDKRPWEECFGGMFYLFLQGLSDQGESRRGVFHFFPSHHPCG